MVVLVSSRLITPKFVPTPSTDIDRSLAGEEVKTMFSCIVSFSKVKGKNA
jgi:hypothetical protein